jgi:hypothetical protein
VSPWLLIHSACRAPNSVEPPVQSFHHSVKVLIVAHQPVRAWYSFRKSWIQATIWAGVKP